MVMQTVQMYSDVPAIELGTDDFSESFGSYAISPGLEQNWTSVDPVSTSGLYHAAHLDHMRKYLIGLTNSAFGCGGSTVFPFPRHDSVGLESSAIWSPGTEAARPTRYMSPHGPWGGSLSSTNSAPSDPALSPGVSRSQAALFRDDVDLSAPFGAHYGVPLSPDQYVYPAQGSCSGTLVASPAPTEQTTACTMKELQYSPDPKNEDALAAPDGINFDLAGATSTSPTSESWTLTAHAPREVDYDESVMTDVSDTRKTDSDIDQESCSSAQLQRTTRPSRQRPLAAPAMPPQEAILKSQNTRHRVVKSSRRQTTAAENKRRKPGGRRVSTKKGEARPFVCSFSHYGCDSRFSSKNEWKRHVASKHLQLGFYRCDTGNCMPVASRPCRPAGGGGGGSSSSSSSSSPMIYNDFNRKDLFTQHHRRMHTPWTPSNTPPNKKASDDFEVGLERIRMRCWKEMRRPPKSSQCVFCPQPFQGDSAWEDRMEHMGKHFEEAERNHVNLGPGREDPELRSWALEEGIIVEDSEEVGGRRCRLADSHGHARGHTDAGHHRGSRRSSNRIIQTRRIAPARDLDEDAVGDDE